MKRIVVSPMPNIRTCYSHACYGNPNLGVGVQQNDLKSQGHSTLYIITFKPCMPVHIG